MNPLVTPARSAVGLALAATLLLSACAGGAATTSSPDTETDTDPASTSSYLGSYTLSDSEFGTETSVSVDGDTRTIVTNALPNTVTGEFPNDGNPNSITAQDITYEYPSTPTFVGDATPVRTTGVALNGLKFEPGTAETVTCDSGEAYRVEALQDVYSLGLDFNNAHVQPTGEYHYHGASELLVDAFDSDEDLVLVGFAADGYLMYYSKSGAYESGYSLSTESRSGTGCVGSSALNVDGVEIDGTAPDGTFTSDWVFSESTGDLDSCNGATVNGEYAYVVTDSYPYVGRCLNGEVTAEAGPGAGGGAGAPDGQNGPPPGGTGVAPQG